MDGSTTATAEAGEDQEVEFGSTVTLSGSGSSTRENPAYSYAWEQTGGVAVTLNGADTAAPTFTAPSVRTDLTFSLTVNDGTYDSAADEVTVAVRPPTQPDERAVRASEAGGRARDCGPAPIHGCRERQPPDHRQFHLVQGRRDRQLRGHSFWFCRPDGTRDTAAPQNVVGTHTETISNLASGTTYWVAAEADLQRLRRRRGILAATGRAFTTTHVATADAGADREVDAGSTVTLDGTGSSSTKSGATLTYAWTQTGGVAVTLDDAASATPSFTAPSVRTDLTFSLTVNDGTVDSDPDTVAVAVRTAGFNPAGAPCVHPKPANVEFGSGNFFSFQSISDDTVVFRGTGHGATEQLLVLLDRWRGP